MDTPEKKDAGQKPATEVKNIDIKKAESSKRRTGMIAQVAGGLIILTLGFGAGWLSGHRNAERFDGAGPLHKAAMFDGGRPMMKHGVDGGSNDVNPTDGSEISHLSGVVTQVNGDTFTIAGNGTTKTIKTDANTNYNVSSKKASVNDSVIVKGTQNGDTFTASSVNVLNR